MKFTKYGHSCFLIEEGGSKILVDPGAFSNGFEGLTDLEGILITHEHQDHLVVDKVKALMATNPKAEVFADNNSAKQLTAAEISVTTVTDGQTFNIGNIKVDAIGVDHAVIHPNFPLVPNVGYLFAEKLFFPGDALTLPEREIEILAIPSVAPWSKVSETIDYLLAVHPKVAIPVHDAITTAPEMYSGMLSGIGSPAGIEIRIAEQGITIDL